MVYSRLGTTALEGQEASQMIQLYKSTGAKRFENSCSNEETLCSQATEQHHGCEKCERQDHSDGGGYSSLSPHFKNVSCWKEYHSAHWVDVKTDL